MIRSFLRKPMLPIAALAFAAASAFAAPVAGPAGNAFYTPPSPLPAGAHGDLIWYRTATVNLGAGAPGVKAWNVLYRSTDSREADNVVTGTVLVPTKAWSNIFTPRPIVSYAVGTHGLAQPCAPSQQFAAGTDYENANIVAALNAGYAVLVTDYAGYTTGNTPTYLAGSSQGRAVLDIVKAAAQIPNVGIKATAKTAIWGYSQGGQSAAWAGELKDSYAADLNVVGVAAGGVPADFLTAARYLDGRNGSSFLLAATIGLAQQYPESIPFDDLASEAGLAAAADAKQICVFESLFKYQNRFLSEFTMGNLPLETLLSLPGIRNALTAQNLGKTKISAPVYQYHGQADWALPLGQAYELKKKYCALGTNVKFDLLPGAEHIVAQFQAAPQVISWLGDRFNGKTAVGTCATTQPDPVSNANPNDGNFVVSLKSWPLTASIGLKTLGQTITLPDTSTFSADTDLTTKQLKNGKLAVPDFKATVNILLPVDVKLSVVPTADATGTATLDNAGMLHVHGLQSANLKIQTVGSLGINIPTGCTTSKPVDFPINFDGPVSSLGNGNLTFAGTTTFPSLTGCGLYGPLLSTLMSGSGQTYSFTVKPPAAKSW
ncbi:MAG: Triacylglycerol lipase [Aquabacterium sp.]|nr:MAG: Triacylglycerol lipase [Aquabacterium sp.]